MWHNVRQFPSMVGDGLSGTPSGHAAPLSGDAPSKVVDPASATWLSAEPSSTSRPKSPNLSSKRTNSGSAVENPSKKSTLDRPGRPQIGALAHRVVSHASSASGQSLASLPLLPIVCWDEIATPSRHSHDDGGIQGRPVTGVDGPFLLTCSSGIDDPENLLRWCENRDVAGLITEMFLPTAIPQSVVSNAVEAASTIERARLGRPDTRLLTIGLVGSAGKTTTGLLIAKLLRDLGLSVYYQTDLGSGCGKRQTASENVCPFGPGLIRSLNDAAEEGCQIAIVEIPDDRATSGAFHSIEWDLLVVTGQKPTPNNFGPCPIDSAMDRLSPDGVAIVPNDPQWLERLDSDVATVTYGFGTADVSIGVAEESGGMSTLLLTQLNETAVMETSLTGSRNAMNHAAAASIGILLSTPLHQIAESLGGLRQLPGRDQRMTDAQAAPVILEASGSPRRAAATIEDYQRQSGDGCVWVVASVHSSDSELDVWGHMLERSGAKVVLTSTPDGDSEFRNAAHRVVDGVRDAAAQRWVASPSDAVAWAHRHAAPEDVVLVLTGRREDTAALQRGVLCDWEGIVADAIAGTTRGKRMAELKLFRG